MEDVSWQTGQSCPHCQKALPGDYSAWRAHVDGCRPKLPMAPTKDASAQEEILRLKARIFELEGLLRKNTAPTESGPDTTVIGRKEEKP